MEAGNYLGRECSEVDNLIVEAAATFDPAKRTELYSEIEEILFGPEGEFPIVPLFQWSSYGLVQT